MRILIIDDEKYIGENTQELLEFEGHSAEVSSTVTEGIRRAQSQAFDIILCDWNLPDGTAADVIQQLPNERVVLMSGTDPKAMSQASVDRKAGYILKPFLIDDLLHVIEQAMAKQK
jgi:DNA-binding response OmpR family regulator